VVLVSNAAEGKSITEEHTREKFSLRTDVMLAAKVLTNMLLNALEATAPGGRVVFRAVPGGSEVAWQVWNEAVIPAGIQLRLFQRFFTTKDGQGHGLGTYSMKLFGEDMLGGRVSFTSEEGQGTTFTFTLPVA
jgi:signal transduction histidine kinase